MWVRNYLAGLVSLADAFRWTHEAVIQLSVLILAVLAVDDVRPCASASFFVEVQSRRALCLGVRSLVANEENVANGRVGMREDAVLAFAEFTRPVCFFWKQILVAGLNKQLSSYEASLVHCSRHWRVDRIFRSERFSDWRLSPRDRDVPWRCRSCIRRTCRIAPRRWIVHVLSDTWSSRRLNK